MKHIWNIWKKQNQQNQSGQPPKVTSLDHGLPSVTQGPAPWRGPQQAMRKEKTIESVVFATGNIGWTSN